MFEVKLDVEEIVNEIKAERHWKSDLNKSDEVENGLNGSLNRWQRYMIVLSYNEQYEDVDKISNEIMELRSFLTTAFPQNHASFVRDLFKVGSLAVSCIEYFKPMQIYRNSTIALKNMSFLIFRDTELILRYHLENCDLFIENYYVLCKMSLDNSMHKQIKVFSNRRPKYQELKRIVADDLMHSMSPIAFSIKPIPANTPNEL